MQIQATNTQQSLMKEKGETYDTLCKTGDDWMVNGLISTYSQNQPIKSELRSVTGITSSASEKPNGLWHWSKILSWYRCVNDTLKMIWQMACRGDTWKESYYYAVLSCNKMILGKPVLFIFMSLNTRDKAYSSQR